jgi:hypothetical protein
MPKKKSKHTGRPKLIDKGIPVTVFYPGSLIVGEENLPFNLKDKKHKEMLAEFRAAIYLREKNFIKNINL